MTPFDQLPCTPEFKDHGQTFKNWTPLIDQSIDLPTALAMSCDTYFYELGKRFYNLPSDRGHPLQGWANRFGLGEQDGHRHRAGGSGSRRDARVTLKKRFPASAGLRRSRPHLEAGLLDPDGDRPGPDARHAAADGAVLRDDRERRQARHAAPRRRTSS